MKRIVALLLVLVLTLPLCMSAAIALADEWDDLSDEDAEALAMLFLLAAMEEEAENQSSSSNSNRSSSSSKSKTPYVAASSAPVTYVTPYNANVKTNGGELNIRVKPNKSATILSKLRNGSSLVVNGYTGDWLQVSANGVTGFVPSRYVTGSAVNTAAASSAPVTYATEYYAIVNPSNNFVNMRSQPTKSSPVVGVYYYGYQLKVLGETGSWSQVYDEATGQSGYMMTSLLLRTSYDVAGEQG